MAILVTLRVFARHLLRGSRRRNTFSCFRFDVWPGVWTRELRVLSQHTINRLRRLLRLTNSNQNKLVNTDLQYWLSGQSHLLVICNVDATSQNPHPTVTIWEWIKRSSILCQSQIQLSIKFNFVCLSTLLFRNGPHRWSWFSKNEVTDALAWYNR